MKPILLLTATLFTIACLFSCKKDQSINSITPTPTTTDSFTLAVNNGYGSGKFKTGDTVHIFSNHYSDNQLFDKWSGDISILNAPEEWHTWFIMPNKNVNLTGSIKNTTAFNLQYELIRGRDRLKPVYSYFPTGHKGFVYLLHGTGGKASFVAAEYEFQILIRDLINDNFGVIITEAEEATTGIDANSDGKLRWAIFPVDTLNNVDYVNIRNITDTFYNRGVTNRSKLRYSLGMSNGAFYSTTLSAIYRYKAGVNYCGQGDAATILATQTPVQFCMAKNDNNDGVGQAGNATALANFNSLNSRGICSKYFTKERCPIYPERFARRGDITTTQSISVFNELKSKGYIDNKHYYIGFSDALTTAYSSNPTSFPVINSLTVPQRSFMLAQIDLSISEHQMYSDYNRVTLKFLNTQCL